MHRILRLDEEEKIEKYNIENKDPIHNVKKTLRINQRSMRKLFGVQDRLEDVDDHDSKYIPNQADVVIIGGGAIGASIAYWVKHFTRHGSSVAVIEKDPTVYF